MESTKLLEILKETIILVSLPDNEFIWTSWRGSEEAVEILQDISAEISAGNLSRLPELKLLFAPTGSLQELSLQRLGAGVPYPGPALRSGRSNLYTGVASRFLHDNSMKKHGWRDRIFKRIIH